MDNYFMKNIKHIREQRGLSQTKLAEMIGAGTAVEEKIDVYDQLAFNWDKFSEYVWENAPLLRSKKSDVIQYDE